MKKSKDTRSQLSSNISKIKPMTLRNRDVAEIIDSPPNNPNRYGFCAVPTQDISEESPYKNFSSEINRTVGSDNDDFATPKAFPKCPIQKPNKIVKKRSYARQTKITRMIEKNFSHTDVNSEHLQMAVALSLSEHENLQSASEEPPIISISETFKKFRFGGAKSEVGNFARNSNKPPNKSRERRKKSRFQYITPILLLRTWKDREFIIATKTSLILSKEKQEQKVDYEKSKLFRDSLQKYQNECRIFHLNSLEVQELNSVSFLVEGLNLELTQSKCGCLLRDWREIAGRDQSPIRTVKVDENDENNTEIYVKTNTATKRSISPELFCSDDEELQKTVNLNTEILDDLEEPPKSPILSQSLIISPKKSTKKAESSDSDGDCKIVEVDNGIIHYESFRDGNKPEVFECFDLTQTSSDDDTEKIDPNPYELSQKVPFDDNFKGEFGGHFERCALKKYGSEGTLNATTTDDDCDKNKPLENKRSSRKCLFKKYHSDMTPIKVMDKENNSYDETLEKSLNVTDYVMKILNKTNCDDFNEIANDMEVCSSQESIYYISDEELNYSSRMSEKNQQKNSCVAESPQNTDKGTPTHSNNSLLIKTTNVTPLINYNLLNTPEIHKYLQNYGLKPLKRRRGVEILNYIYETTHPVVNPDGGDKKQKSDGDDDERAVKKSKIVPERQVKSAPEQDWIFERKQSSKTVSCRIPLQVAWHNLVSNNPELHESILTYEPLQLEVLHDMLKEQGFKFHIEDLVTFLDKKCITFCTNQNKGPNARRRAKFKKKIK